MAELSHLDEPHQPWSWRRWVIFVGVVAGIGGGGWILGEDAIRQSSAIADYVDASVAQRWTALLLSVSALVVWSMILPTAVPIMLIGYYSASMGSVAAW